MAANIGKIIPVAVNPKMALTQDVPVSNPIEGGKIKFPAPKNTAKSAKLQQYCPLIFCSSI